MFLKLGTRFTILQENQNKEIAEQTEESQKDIDLLAKLVCESTKVMEMQASDCLQALKLRRLKPRVRRSLTRVLEATCGVDIMKLIPDAEEETTDRIKGLLSDLKTLKHTLCAAQS